MKKLIFPSLVCIIISSASYAITINIPGDYPTIQAGINASNDGDTVLVAAGNYNEHLEFLGKDIVLTSVEGPETTTIDPASIGAVVTFTECAGEGGVITGFTITNSYFWNSGLYSGLKCDTNSTPTIRGNIITDIGGQWAYGGAGIRAIYASPIIEENVITNNECVYWGGGIYLDNCTNAVIYHNIIMGNVLTSGYGTADGGGICIKNSSAIVSRNIICFNTTDPSYSRGGGMNVQFTGHYKIVNNTIVGNIGAGFYPMLSDSNHVVRNNIIIENSVDGGIATFSTTILNSDFNDVWNNTPQNYVNVNPGPNDISVDPAFTTGPLHSYYLSSNSPCIDAGDPESPRDPDGTIADLGAEYYDQGIIELTLTPDNPPIQIPAGGGAFQFDISVENTSMTTAIIDVWIEAIMPDGRIYSPILLRPGITLSALQNLVREDMTQNVPANTPSGEYCYIANAGSFGIGVTASDTFAFEKLAGIDMHQQSDDWSVEGWDVSGEQTVMSVPSTSELFTPYPNPFNASIVISYQLSAASLINLTVYDITGREAANLVDGYESAGNHEVIFDAKDLVSGVYFVRLTVDGGQSMVRKMVLLK